MKYLVEVTDVRVFVEVDAETDEEAAHKGWEGDGQILFDGGVIVYEDVKTLPIGFEYDTGILGEEFDSW